MRSEHRNGARMPTLRRNHFFTLLENIRFEQSLFTLPFAYIGMILAARGLPSFGQFVWITLAMVGARTFGMNMNRIVDLDLDRQNPRAAARPLPSGRLSLRAVWLYCAASVVLLFFAAVQLNPLCVYLFPVAMLVFTGYSYVKRFSWVTHMVLGAALAGAPVGGWIAVTGSLSVEPLLLFLTVWTWATGFDILYACGDTDEDRRLGVHTISVDFGLATALAVSAAFHAGTVLMLAVVGLAFHLSWPYWLGVTVVTGLLVYEHSIVRPNDLSRLTTAFFTINGYISTLVFAATAASLFL